jgi:hypothetical protein
MTADCSIFDADRNDLSKNIGISSGFDRFVVYIFAFAVLAKRDNLSGKRKYILLIPMKAKEDASLTGASVGYHSCI